MSYSGTIKSGHRDIANKTTDESDPHTAIGGCLRIGYGGYPSHANGTNGGCLRVGNSDCATAQLGTRRAKRMNSPITSS